MNGGDQMSYMYKTKGTCSMIINIDMNGNVLEDVSFEGGCNGNLKAISSLVKGMTYEEIRGKVGGITCGFKSTSCADQLVKGMEEAMAAGTK